MIDAHRVIWQPTDVYGRRYFELRDQAERYAEKHRQKYGGGTSVDTVKVENLIDLHTHSRFSDGAHTIEQMARECKKLGHSACAITDHVSAGEGPMTMSRENWLTAQAHAKVVQEAVGIPVILGIELSVNRMEECCVFGHDAINAIFELRERNARWHTIQSFKWKKNGDGTSSTVPGETEERRLYLKVITIEDLYNIRQVYPCVINLAHPGNIERFIEAGGHEILDGFERVHARTDMFLHPNKEHDRPIPPEFECLAQVSNSDAHQTACVGLASNIAEFPIRSELDLIEHYDQGKVFGHLSGDPEKPFREDQNGKHK